jgi:hypothetical protein
MWILLCWHQWVQTAILVFFSFIMPGQNISSSDQDQLLVSSDIIHCLCVRNYVILDDCRDFYILLLLSLHQFDFVGVSFLNFCIHHGREPFYLKSFRNQVHSVPERRTAQMHFFQQQAKLQESGQYPGLADSLPSTGQIHIGPLFWQRRQKTIHQIFGPVCPSDLFHRHKSRRTKQTIIISTLLVKFIPIFKNFQQDGL